ncbi:MAG TPA: EAL domain-containing protein [Cellulomonas sp.]
MRGPTTAAPEGPLPAAAAAPAVSGAGSSAAPHRAARAGVHRAIDEVIDTRAVRTVFQPVVELATGTVVGFEALSRGPAGTDLESPLALLAAAGAAGRVGELDWLCRTSAMRAAVASGLDPGLSWFLNVEPAGLETDCPAPLRPVLDRARRSLRVVLEVVERDVDGHVIRLLHATDQARRDGWGVAVDDVGAEAASLSLLPFLCPDVVKLDMALLSERPSAHVSRVTAIVRAYAERTGAAILAEGIETVRHAELAGALGAVYGQGYLYGRPGPLPASVPPVGHPVPIGQRPEPLTGATPFEVVNAAVSAQRARRDDLAHIVTHLRSTGQDPDDPGVLLTVLEDEAQYRELAADDEAAAAVNAFTVCLVAGGTSRRSEPRHHVEPLSADAAIGRELTVIVVRPHYCAALTARPVEPRGRPGPGASDHDHDHDHGHDHGQSRDHGQQPYDYVYTHDRATVVDAARALLAHLQPDPIASANAYQVRPVARATTGRRWTPAGANGPHDPVARRTR